MVLRPWPACLSRLSFLPFYVTVKDSINSPFNWQARLAVTFLQRRIWLLTSSVRRIVASREASYKQGASVINATWTLFLTSVSTWGKGGKGGRGRRVEWQHQTASPHAQHWRWLFMLLVLMHRTIACAWQEGVPTCKHTFTALGGVVDLNFCIFFRASHAQFSSFPFAHRYNLCLCHQLS